MSKYIDADRLKAEIEGIRWFPQISSGYNDGREDMKIMVLDIITSLQQEQSDEVLIPKWCLWNIENTLRIQHNINSDLKDGETCQDRNIKESLNCVRKLLNGEEITGLERLEPLMKQPEVELSKEVHKKVLELHTAPCYDELEGFARHFYELGRRAERWTPGDKCKAIKE